MVGVADVKTLEEDNEYFDGVMNTEARMQQPNFTKLYYNEQFDIGGGRRY